MPTIPKTIFIPGPGQKAVTVEEETLVSQKYFFRDSELSDIILQVEDLEFHCHKMVLANASDFFKTMFFGEGEFVERNATKIQMGGVRPSTFRRVLELAYDRTISDPHRCLRACEIGQRTFWRETHDLLRLLDCFFMAGTYQKYIESQISHEHCKCCNCFGALVFATVFDLKVKQEKPRYYFLHEVRSWWEEYGELTDDNPIPTGKILRIIRCLRDE